MLDTSSLVKTIENCDIVFHLAANSTVRLGAIDTKPDYQQNLLATYNLLEAMRKSSACKKIILLPARQYIGMLR
jgi:UDP-glucose 4-epimerase